jgi:hypothetical protein
MVAVPVSAILQRVPERARAAYSALTLHPDTQEDWVTGWAYSYLSQDALAQLLGASLRTATRAVADLRAVGLMRVLTWPGASTETSLRIGDVSVPESVFGPVRMMQAIDPAFPVDQAIAQLCREYDEILWDIELSYVDYTDGGI